MAVKLRSPKKTGGACTPTRFITLTPQAEIFSTTKFSHPPGENLEAISDIYRLCPLLIGWRRSA